VASSTGRVSNLPPLLRLDPVDPDTVIGLFNRIQYVTGTFGGDEELGDNLELGANFTLTVVWDDELPPNVVPNIHAGDLVELFVDEEGQGTYTITHQSDTGPIQISLARKYPIQHLITVPDFVHATVIIDNDQNIRAYDVRPVDLNSVSDGSSTRVATELLRYAEPSPAFVPPAPLRAPEAAGLLLETHTPTGMVTLIEEVRPPTESTVAKWRLVYLVRVLPDGAETDPHILPDDALHDLVRLFDRFRQEGLPNGRYRVYLQEIGFPARRVIEFYKSGNTFGDPIHEPGPGANPVPRDQPAPESKSDRSAPAPELPPRAAILDGARGEDSLPMGSGSDRAEDIVSLPAASGRDCDDGDGFSALGDSPRRLSRPVIGALAASLGALTQQIANDRWEKRLDQALESSSRDSLSRRARLRRRLVAERSPVVE